MVLLVLNCYNDGNSSMTQATPREYMKQHKHTLYHIRSYRINIPILIHILEGEVFLKRGSAAGARGGGGPGSHRALARERPQQATAATK